MAEQRGGQSFGVRKWRKSTKSVLNGIIPYTPEYIKLIRDKKSDFDCECEADCNCHWTPEVVPSCDCLLNNQECQGSCAGCDGVMQEGLSDNRQIQRNGLTPKQTKPVWLNDKMGHSLVICEDFKAGDALICFAGNIILESTRPPDHQVYVVNLGHHKFKLLKDFGGYQEGEIFEGEWSMDSTDFGTDGNLINSTCGNNNAQAYTQIVCGLPIPVVYAEKDGKKGLFSKYTPFMSVHCIKLVYDDV